MFIEHVAIPGLPNLSLENLLEDEDVTITHFSNTLIESVEILENGSERELLIRPQPGLQDGQVYHTTIEVMVEGNPDPVTLYVKIPTPRLTEGPPELNHVTGFYQKVIKVENLTNYPFEALRVYVHDLQEDATLRSQSGVTEEGVPFIQFDLELESGEERDFRLEFLTESRLWTASETYILEVLPSTEALIAPTVLDQAELDLQIYEADQTSLFVALGTRYLNFLTEEGVTYYIQYSDGDTENWRTSAVTV